MIKIAIKVMYPSMLLLLCCSIPSTYAGHLTSEQQQEILKNYMYVTGQTMQLPSQALEAVSGYPEELPVKCGTPAVLDFVFNHDKLDPELLQALGVEVWDRPTYANELIYDSPNGLFKVHYTTSGTHAVYQADVDSNGDGVPDYVEDVAGILDSVYVHIIDTLGYDPPPTDGFYPSGGDDKYDVYISNLGGGIFGYTYPDEYAIDDTNYTRATSFIEIENDYQEMPAYKNRPLDAVRVTCAHEFFHAVQFGIDVTEAEPGPEESVRPYWMEMSAVWMEEEIYDDINDYYAYLPFFFNYPRQSIQQFRSTVADFHPYASVVFPIYLSERFGRDIIKDIWLRCDENAGPDFLLTADRAIDSISEGSHNWASAFREFVLWNYFTGQRANYAPDAVGFSEREMYPAIPDTAIVKHTEYPVLQLANENPRNPEHNAAFYVTFDSTACLQYDTSFWVCNSGTFPDCHDSTQVTDPASGYDIRHIDSLFSMYVILGDGQHLTPPQPWGLNVVFQLDSIRDLFIADQFFLPYIDTAGVPSLLQIIDPNLYHSITMIISPASYRREAYHSPDYDFSLGYYVPESLFQVPTAIEEGPDDLLPKRFALSQNYPNPFNLSTTILFSLPSRSHVVITIYNVLGQRVTRLVNEVKPAGSYHVDWDGKDQHGQTVASGVYLYELKAGEYVDARKMLLLK